MNGKPVLIRKVLDLHLAPPAGRQDLAEHSVVHPPREDSGRRRQDPSSWFRQRAQRRSTGHLARCTPVANVDLVAEAEELPFHDNTLDHVDSGAVFEHLHNPWKAVAEIKRVLKPGGTFRIDTAFMQGYHGFPGHYYNMTPQAIETHLVGDFKLRDSYVPNSSTPLMTIQMIITRYLGYISR